MAAIQGSVNKLVNANFVQDSKSTKFVLKREQEPEAAWIQSF